MDQTIRVSDFLVRRWSRVVDIEGIVDLIEELEWEIEHGDTIPEDAYERNGDIVLTLEYYEKITNH